MKKVVIILSVIVCVVVGVIALFAVIGFVAYSHHDPRTSVQVAPTATPAVKLTKDQAIAARKAYAKVIDGQLLDMGIESTTFTSGPDASTLTIKDVLAGRVRANAISKNGNLFDQLRALGFKELKYTNGFESDLYFGMHWKL